MNYIEIASKTLQIEIESLQHSMNNLGSFIDDAIQLILTCRGKLIITGVGKSGLIGAKMAATFASTGTPSFFLHPTEALHGDLGMIGSEDIVLAISYSGESSELSAILPHVKRFDIPLIGMTSNVDSTLGKFSDVVIPINITQEACPLEIAPTSSTTLTLALGDALAVCLMRARDFKKEDFASFHPGGSLGRKLFLKVKDLMKSENLPIINKNASLKEAIVSITEGRLGTALIVDEKQNLVALLSDGDIRRSMLNEEFNINDNVLKYATLKPITLKDENMLASDALTYIEKMKIQLLVITDEHNKIEGVLHLHSLVEAGIS